MSYSFYINSNFQKLTFADLQNDEVGVNDQGITSEVPLMIFEFRSLPKNCFEQAYVYGNWFETIGPSLSFKSAIFLIIIVVIVQKKLYRFFVESGITEKLYLDLCSLQ